MRSSLFRDPMLWCACIVHMAQGIAVIVEEHARSITALAFFAFIPVWLYGGIILATTFLALIALTWYSPTHRYIPSTNVIWLLIPQQVLICIGAFGGLQAVFLGQYGDMAVYPRGFIGADQSPIIFLMFFHFIALLRFSSRNFLMRD